MGRGATDLCLGDGWGALYCVWGSGVCGATDLCLGFGLGCGATDLCLGVVGSQTCASGSGGGVGPLTSLGVMRGGGVGSLTCVWRLWGH